MNSYRISFGPGIRRSLNESFKEAKARNGIIASLPMSEEPLLPQAPMARPVPKPPPKEETAKISRVIVELVERFCREKLTDEYDDLCRKLAEKLARKQPSPLLSGDPKTWACGIVRTIGWVNFLHEPA